MVQYGHAKELIMDKYCIFGDESCHLRNDGIDFMAFGAIWCKEQEVQKSIDKIKEIKQKYCSKYQELKWSKISPSNVNLYKEVLDYFYIEDDLNFRCYIIKNKSNFKFEDKYDFDKFYYKSYFQMLNNILTRNDKFKIYLDMKDSRSIRRINKLKEVLQRANSNFNEKIILSKIQTIRSYESQLMQLADILIGSIIYKNRGLNTSPAKLEIIKFIEDKFKINLSYSTLMRERKINIFYNTSKEHI